jgi:hypothetical protein
MKSSLLKKTLFILSLVCFSMIGFSQENGKNAEKREKIEQLKIAFITTELSLSESDAKVFWPVYDEMTSKLKKEKRIQRQKRNELEKNADSYSESEFKAKSEDLLNSEIKEMQIKKEYHTQIAEIIGYKKATKLLSLEQRFKRELLNKLNEGRSAGGRPNESRSRQ